MDYLELSVVITPRNPWAEILIAQLADNGFESFVDTENGIQAYAPIDAVNTQNPIQGTFASNPPDGISIEWTIQIIKQQNWNAAWEADFEPVFVDDYLAILAPFHERSTTHQLTVEILPKMSFGTGHHQTTWMMSKAMFELDKMPANVLDMGTGTGILAIIAEKLGATDILAIDIEDWSVENTVENAQRNACTHIKGICGGVEKIEGDFGLILANINKNVLKAQMQTYSNHLEQNGKLLLSGFFFSDIDELISCAEEVGLKKNRILNKDNWACIELDKR